MIERDRVLRPLREAESAMSRLDTYESPAVLLEALRATWHAVELTLRTLLRGDETAPDRVRLTAMSEGEMPVDQVVTELRRRELVSLPLAGRLHELRQALDRAAAGDVRAADADLARDVVQLLESEVDRVARSRPAGATRESATVEAAAPQAAGVEVGDDIMSAIRRGPRRPLWVAGATITVLVVIMIVMFVRGRSSDMDRGVTAFQEGRAGLAEQHFRTVLSRDDANVTARLYLARILRDQARLQEAADQLRTAARTAPEDAAVRRELGYLFLDLDRPPAAVEQFRTAVELEPDESLNWVGLVLAMRRAGDRSAEEWLRRAPAEAQALLRPVGS